VSALTPSSSAASPIRNIVTPGTLPTRTCGMKVPLQAASAVGSGIYLAQSRLSIVYQTSMLTKEATSSNVSLDFR